MFPSIFNEVIGPVMRGPSSSHSAASQRIGKLCRELVDCEVKQVLAEFDLVGSLATTHRSQGSDMGLCGGFLGWEADAEHMVRAEQYAADAGIEYKVVITDIGGQHPNTYQLTLTNDKETHFVTALSVGGGAIQVIGIDNCSVNMKGDYFELVIFGADEATIAEVRAAFPDCLVHTSEPNTTDRKSTWPSTAQQPPPITTLINVKSQVDISAEKLAEIRQLRGVSFVRKLNPVVPIISRPNLSVPFSTANQLVHYNSQRNLPLWQLAVHYEASRGNLSHDEVLARMEKLTDLWYNSCLEGVKGTHFNDRIVGCQSVGLHECIQKNQLLDNGSLLNQILLHVTAMMEVKSSYGVIVAAPTAGSCGCLPGTIFGAVKHLELTLTDMAKAMLGAGLIGVLIAQHSSFAAEEGGCQMECGSASAMTAAALVDLKGGSADQALTAASMALQSTLGMICDPVGNRVEMPCLYRNTLAASNALSCANMALCGMPAVIPFDEVIQVHWDVGKAMPRELKCTGLGGLATTPTARRIEAELDGSADKESDGLLAGTGLKGGCGCGGNSCHSNKAVPQELF